MRKRQCTKETKKLAVNAVLSGESRADVARMFGVNDATIYRWVKKYQLRQDFNDLHHAGGSGRRPVLTEMAQIHLIDAALRPASEFGFDNDLWTAPRLAKVANERLNISVSDDTVWRMLREWGLSYKKPEKRYIQRDDTAVALWRKQELPKILETVQKFKAILYFEDEASICFSPVLGKTWAPVGTTPTISVTGSRGRISAISAVNSAGLLLFRLFDKNITSEEIIEFFCQMLQRHPRRHLVVVMDNASPHTSRKILSFVERQKRLHIFYFPPYAPDLNPDEKVWNYLKNEALKAHKAKNKNDLINITNRKLKEMSEETKTVRGIFNRSELALLLR